MNAMSDVSTVNRFTRALEDTEARRLGIKTVEARERIASKIGISPGTLENLRRMRTKIVPNWLMNRVRQELISVLQSEIQRLEHEVSIAKQVGADHSGTSLVAIQTHIVEARSLLEREVK